MVWNKKYDCCCHFSFKSLGQNKFEWNEIQIELGGKVENSIFEAVERQLSWLMTKSFPPQKKKVCRGPTPKWTKSHTQNYKNLKLSWQLLLVSWDMEWISGNLIWERKRWNQISVSNGILWNLKNFVIFSAFPTSFSQIFTQPKWFS